MMRLLEGGSVSKTAELIEIGGLLRLFVRPVATRLQRRQDGGGERGEILPALSPAKESECVGTRRRPADAKTINSGGPFSPLFEE